jgi:hypothetical protein
MAIVQKSQSGVQKPDTRSPSPAKPAAGGAPPTEKIAARAYEIWQASGRPDGHDMDHWLQAERELRGAQQGTRTLR